MGESVVEAVIGEWLVEPGQAVEKFDPLVEIVTDKVAMELPSPAAGTITKSWRRPGTPWRWEPRSPKWMPTGRRKKKRRPTSRLTWPRTLFNQTG